ncbi:TVP38/TMEM64 family protein [Fictibacillus gelatini]|uniref:TVP38/TMEM64 family protein n=1 Tax=Fictibacillus gelatini TaxID=225985 RepID=UPI0004127FF7|nr:VTT domain-containing protein [Fictibacillus gelatini]
MADQLLSIFNEYRTFAVAISLVISVVIAVLGVVPSFFLTAANILFFGFWTGFFLSFLGESLGAIISFVIYRAGFQTIAQEKLYKHPRLRKLAEMDGREAFMAVINLRLLPFIPSGVVTFGSAIGKMSVVTFAIASSIGKLPALFIEVFSVYHVEKWTMAGKIIIGLIALYGLLWLWKIKHNKGAGGEKG